MSERANIFYVHLSGVKVRPCQHVFQMYVTIWLVLLEFDHRVCLSQKRTSSSQLTQFYQLHHNLPHHTVNDGAYNRVVLYLRVLLKRGKSDVSYQSWGGGEGGVPSSLSPPKYVCGHDLLILRNHVSSSCHYLLSLHGACHVEASHLLVEVHQCLVRKLQGLYPLQDRVPMTMVDLRHKALDAVHCVQGHSSLLLATQEQLHIPWICWGGL